MDLTLDTTEKVVSLIAGALAIGGVILWRKKASGDASSDSNNNNVSTNSQNVVVNVAGSQPEGRVGAQKPFDSMSVSDLKKSARVLFVDDDKGFKIVGVLKKMGWEHTKIVTDITSLEQAALNEAHVVFVDIQGVGRAMQYENEGLGLALAIKRRCPEKRVVIYSAQEEGARFHEALQEADYSLSKTAEPIRFEETIVKVLRK